MKQLPQNLTINISSGTILKSMLFALLIAGIYFLWDIVLVVLAAIVIASAIEPMTRKLMKYQFPRTLAVVLIYLGLGGFMSMIIYFFIPPVLEEAANFLSNLPNQLEIGDILRPIGDNGPSFLQPSIDELSQSLSIEQLVSGLRTTVTSISQSLFKILSAVFGGLMSLMLIIVLSFYLAVQDDGIVNFLKIITPIKHEKYIIDLWRRSQAKIGRWMEGQLVLMLIIGVLTYLGLLLLDVRYALLLAVLAAFFEIIPIFGPILSAIPAVALGFADGGLSSGLLIAGLYVIIQQFENHLIYPLVVRQVVGVPPLLVILAIIIGARIGGFMGAILAVPMAAAFREYISDVEKYKLAEEKKLIETVNSG
jgi:predicted PurR-regulated permease PerM